MRIKKWKKADILLNESLEADLKAFDMTLIESKLENTNLIDKTTTQRLHDVRLSERFEVKDETFKDYVALKKSEEGK